MMNSASVWISGCLLAASWGPCVDLTGPMPLPDELSDKGGQQPTPVAPAAEQPAPAASRPTQQTPTTRTYMQGHFADSVRLRRAMVAGNLADFKQAASAVANDEWSSNLRPDYRPYVAAVRAAAATARAAESLKAGAVALGTLGVACAACHQHFGAPQIPIAPGSAPEATEPSMVAHAAATDRLWEGVMGPSDTSWFKGTRGLMEAPSLDSDVPDVAAAAQHLRQLAEEALSVSVEQRGRLFGQVLMTCAGCHERVGVVVSSARAVR